MYEPLFTCHIQFNMKYYTVSKARESNLPMSIDQPTGAHFAPTYRSGTCARLAGIPVETLRVWERRYGVVGPALSARGHRLYSAEDVSRLTLIKHLVSIGTPIGSIATLPLGSLRAMRDAANTAARGASQGSTQTVRVALVGQALTERAARDAGGIPHLNVVATCADPAFALDQLRGVSADMLAVELPTLQFGSVAIVDEMVAAVGARCAVVAYRFGPGTVVNALRARGHAVTQSPLDLVTLERLCRDAIHHEPAAGRPMSPLMPLEAVPPRRFDDRSLAQIAEASTTLYCECPRQVAEFVLNLGTFEHYSAECANRGEADAAMHRYLQRVAGTARALFEDALVLVAKAEGLALPNHTGAKAPDSP